MSLSDFVLIQKIGVGSFASVYKVRRLIDNNMYALKQIDMKALSSRQKNNALNEVRLLACFNSHYIISYFESFYQEKNDLLCIAMQYAEEGDLLRLIQKHKKQRTLLPEIQIWKMLIHLLYGINQLHARNILHRDLKSQNVFISKGTYKIGDMNVSKIIKNGLAVTQTGTPYYASPEVWSDQPYNQKSDIWSLGCILYQISALKPPFEANSMDKLFSHITKTPTPKIPKTYSKQLQSIIDKCLEKNPLNRPSAKSLLQNSTVKLYENLLIEFKPDIDLNRKESMLKTIYMPNSKKQLKNQLPQSNYKQNTGSKQLKKQQKQVEKLKIATERKKQQTVNNFQELKQNIESSAKSIKTKENNAVQISASKPLCLQKQNIIQVVSSSDSGKKVSLNKKRGRIQPCQIFKEAVSNSSQMKRIDKYNLFERAQAIIQSQKKSNQKQHYSVVNTEKKEAQKNSQEKAKEKEIQQGLSDKKKSMQNLLEQVQQLQPIKLVFQQSSNEQKNIKLLTQIQQQASTHDIPQTHLSEQITCEQITSELTRQLQKSKIITNDYILEIFPKKDRSNSINVQLKEENICVSPLRNVSTISEKNHQQYDFKLQKNYIPREAAQRKTQDKLPNEQTEKNKQKSSALAQYIKIQQREKYSFEINQENSEKQLIYNIKKQPYQKTQTQTLIKESRESQNNESKDQMILSEKVHIVVDLNEHYSCQKTSKYNYNSQEMKINLVLSLQKIRTFVKRMQFLQKLQAYSQIRKFYENQLLRIKEEQVVLKIYRQSSRIIRQTLNGNQERVTQIQYDKSKQLSININNAPFQVKKNRSKSMPKTQRLNKLCKQVNHLQSIKKPLSKQIPSHGKLNDGKQLKKQVSRKKIFEFGNESNQTEGVIKKISEMPLLPVPSQSLLEENQIHPIKQVYKQLQNDCKKHIQTDQKRHALSNFISNPKLNSPQKGLFVQEKICQNFLQKKKRIFQNNQNFVSQSSSKKVVVHPHNHKKSENNPNKGKNLISELNEKLDKIDLQKRMKKYMII